MHEIAVGTLALSNAAAWAEIEVRLADAGVARREWMRARAAVWGLRRGMKAEPPANLPQVSGREGAPR